MISLPFWLPIPFWDRGNQYGYQLIVSFRPPILRVSPVPRGRCVRHRLLVHGWAGFDRTDGSCRSRIAASQVFYLVGPSAGRYIFKVSCNGRSWFFGCPGKKFPSYISVPKPWIFYNRQYNFSPFVQVIEIPGLVLKCFREKIPPLS